jgi:flagellar assembly protein FliH
VHPDDATILRASMGEQLSHTGWKIFEDALITRGGLRIETSHSQIDATMENRWQRIVASIGQDSSWIQE